jgi:Flp pilus assembly protein TadG
MRMIEIDWKLHAIFIDTCMPCPRNRKAAYQAARKIGKRQRGAISIMFVLTILVMFGFIGLAFDLAMVYNRKVELQGMADAAAMAAARELIGTQAGVTNALTKAASTASSFKYRYHTRDVAWSNAAIRFSTSETAAEGDWLDAAAASSSPDGLLFAKVDTSALDSDHDTVSTTFMGIFAAANATARTSGRAVAGRSKIKVTPIGICALSPTAANSRANPGPPANFELEEFGFRRGVGYDLLNLNPNGSTPEHFVINPIDPIGSLGISSNTAPAVVGPFVCAGTMPMPRVMGAPISVSRPFPIAALFNHLNSRFDQYPGAQCSPLEAPPDFNIKAFVFSSIPWMSGTPGAPGQQTALSTSPATPLSTVASPFPAPTTNTAPKYGPLWSFARAVPFSAYVPGSPEPTNGYTPFATTAWATLYRAGCAIPSCVPAPPPTPLYTGSTTVTPYMATGGANFLAPSPANFPGLRYRRVLNVPLLACPVAAGTNVTATVLAIGRFFMTVPATTTSINAEFAGIVPEQSLGGRVEIYR